MTANESVEKKISYDSKVILNDGDVGTVKFVGLLAQKKNVYYGIDLIKGDGKNDGSIGKPKKIRYFKSKKKKSGRFVTIEKISKVTNNSGPCYFDEVVLKKNSKLQGIIKYIGIPNFSNATSVHYGIELNTPDGDCNGSKKSQKYFNCKKKHGLFAKGNEIILLSEFKKSLSKKRDSLTVKSLPVSSQSVKKLLKDRNENTTSNKPKKRISVTIPKDQMKKALKNQSPKKNANKKVAKSKKSTKSTKLTKPKKSTKITSPKKSTKSSKLSSKKPSKSPKKSTKSPKKSVKSPKKSVKSPKAKKSVKSPKKSSSSVKSPKKSSNKLNNGKKSNKTSPKKSNKKKITGQKKSKKSGNKKSKNSKKEKLRTPVDENVKISKYLLNNFEINNDNYLDPVDICEKYLEFENKMDITKDDLTKISKMQRLMISLIENNFKGVTQSEQGFGLCVK